jgi:hypothetical protein
MSVIPDLHSLDTTAARLDQRASELRTRALRLQVACETVDWQSVAASRFRRRGDTACTSLRQCAERLEHAAFVLRHHAATARSRARRVEHLVDDGLSLIGL